MYKNDLLNGGCIMYRGEKVCGFIDDRSYINIRCKENKADAAFIFMSFALCISCAVLLFLAMKRGIKRKGALV